MSQPVTTALPVNTAYERHDLVSDLPGADLQDKRLVNPWGIAFSPTGPLWVNNAGIASVRDAAGRAAPAANPLVVAFPAIATPADPSSSATTTSFLTGIVFAGGSGIEVTPGKPASFIFATKDGRLGAWNPQVDATHAVIKLDNSANGAVYTGLTMATGDHGTLLYAANFANRTIDAFNTGFFPAALRGTFSDPGIPVDYSPFNIQNINGKLYVTYAKPNLAEILGVGNGYVNVFDTEGRILQRFASNGTLNAPWGVVLTPASFGDFGNTLLVGNFGDGKIQGYDPVTGAPKGFLSDAAGNEFAIEGLWALVFGNGGQGGDANALYFTAGIPGTGVLEDHGVFGVIRVKAPAVPASSGQ